MSDNHAIRNGTPNALLVLPKKPTPKEVLWRLVDRMPFGDRSDPLLAEMLRVLSSQPCDVQKPVLPTYCYNIFEKARRAEFGAFPSVGDTVICPDPSKLAMVKSVEEAKAFVNIDWYRFGKLIGILLRVMRFLDLEAEELVKGEGFLDMEPEREKMVLALLGSAWLERNGIRVAELPPGGLGRALIKVVESVCPDRSVPQYWNGLAFEWGADTMAEFHRGIADGLMGFMDASGQLVGETTRAGNYAFFLLLWPEIGDLLARNPLPNRTEVFNWLTPFHEAGFVSIPEIGYFHDFCESIGLKFAGRLAKIR